MKFTKKVKLQEGGYLVDAVTENPVFHSEFVEQQKNVHYLIELSKNLKKINIKGRKMLMKLINDIILWSIWLGAMFLAFIVFNSYNYF